MKVEVEFFGIPRQRTGTPRTTVETGRVEASLGNVLAILAHRFPEFATNCLDDGRLRRGYIININGEQFATDPDTFVRDGQTVLIMSADAGG